MPWVVVHNGVLTIVVVVVVAAVAFVAVLLLPFCPFAHLFFSTPPDLYVTLVNGFFNKDGKRSHKNVSISVFALLEDGTEVKCMQRGGDHAKMGGTAQLTSSYTSTVLYHNGSPHYNETLKISLDVQNAMKAHLVFIYSHISSKKKKTSVFGFSFLPLRDLSRRRRSTFRTLGGSNSPLLRDGYHKLQTYAPVIGISKLLEPGARKGKVLRPLTSYLDDTGRNKPLLRKDYFR